MLYESSYYGISDLGDSLTHHGIKGQKWGVRRFQDAYGRLTEAGRIRYSTDMKEKYGLHEHNPNKSQAWDNARDMASRGAKKSEIKKYLRVNKLPVREWFKDEPYEKYKKEAVKFRHEQDKQDAIRIGDPTRISKYASELTTQQLSDAVNRAALVKRLSDLQQGPKKERKDFLTSFTNTGNKIVNAANTAKNIKDLFKKKEKDEAVEKYKDVISKTAPSIATKIRDNTEGSIKDKERAVKKAIQEMYEVADEKAPPKKKKKEASIKIESSKKAYSSSDFSWANTSVPVKWAYTSESDLWSDFNKKKKK